MISIFFLFLSHSHLHVFFSGIMSSSKTLRCVCCQNDFLKLLTSCEAVWEMYKLRKSSFIDKPISYSSVDIGLQLPAAKDVWALCPGCFSRVSVCSLHPAFHQLSHGGGVVVLHTSEWRMDICLDVGRFGRKLGMLGKKNLKTLPALSFEMNLYASQYYTVVKGSMASHSQKVANSKGP